MARVFLLFSENSGVFLPMRSNIIRLKSKRGGDIIILDDHIYNYHSIVPENNRKRFRCSIRECYGAIVVDGNIVTLFTAHNHEANAGKAKKKTIMSKIKETSTNSNATIGNILDRVVGADMCNPEVVDILPTFKSLRNSINGSRNPLRRNINPQVDDIPEQLKEDRLDRDFMRYDSGIDSANRFLLFIYEDKPLRMSCSDILVVDATFRTVPHPFYQLLVVHVVFLDRTFPLAYSLITNKTEESYKSVFEKIKAFTGISPRYIVTDFEKALSNGANYAFSANCFFCYFHLDNPYGESYKLIVYPRSI